MIKNTIIFGDIHGCDKALKRAIEYTENNHLKAIFLGDYVDRGPNSILTLQYLIEAREKHPDWIFIRGNHDQMLLDLIEKKALPNSEGTVLNSYGFSYERTTETYNQLLNTDKDFQGQVYDFLKETIFYFESENFIFVHAPLKDSSIPISSKPKEELIWNYEETPKWKGKPFVHGHRTVDEITITGKGINVNTSCGFGGELTGLIDYSNDRLEFVQFSEDGERWEVKTQKARQ